MSVASSGLQMSRSGSQASRLPYRSESRRGEMRAHPPPLPQRPVQRNPTRIARLSEGTRLLEPSRRPSTWRLLIPSDQFCRQHLRYGLGLLGWPRPAHEHPHRPVRSWGELSLGGAARSQDHLLPGRRPPLSRRSHRPREPREPRSLHALLSIHGSRRAGRSPTDGTA